MLALMPLGITSVGADSCPPAMCTMASGFALSATARPDLSASSLWSASPREMPTMPAASSPAAPTTRNTGRAFLARAGAWASTTAPPRMMTPSAMNTATAPFSLSVSISRENRKATKPTPSAPSTGYSRACMNLPRTARL